MLINCPECELQVSDKALQCPHCGYPLKGVEKISRTRKTNKRKRLPNGFGQISELKGRNLRKPFRVMVTIGKDTNGKPVSKLLKPEAYFATYNDAYMALMDYHRNPVDESENITMLELYDMWMKKYVESGKAASSINLNTNAWKYCSTTYDIPVKNIRPTHIKNCMENGFYVDNKNKMHTTTNNIQQRIKNLFNMLLDYALEYGYVEKNYSRVFGSDAEIKVEKEHIPYIAEEVEALWRLTEEGDNTGADMLIIQIYSGWRPGELCTIELKNVHLDEGYMVGGLKTDAGRDREVPIHPKIFHLLQKYHERATNFGSEYLFVSPKGRPIKYAGFKNRLDKIVDLLNLNPEHRPHDGRATFITMAKKAKLDEYAIKYIVGHSIDDLTEKVYTHREISWLIEEIEKIK